MIRAIVVDDEKPSRDRVRFFLEDIKEISIVGEAENGEKGLRLLEKERPDLVFLDIQMPISDGLTVLENCSYHPAVIFISAYDEYAIRAFDVNAVDYLLKPYTRERFNRAIERVLKNVDDSAFWESRINAFLDSYRNETGRLERITVKRGHTFKIYEAEDIDFFRMEDGLLFLYSSGERINIDAALNQLEGRMDGKIFLRVHRNALINLKRIKQVVPWGQGRLVLEFEAQQKVHVSREKVRLLKERIGLGL